MVIQQLPHIGNLELHHGRRITLPATVVSIRPVRTQDGQRISTQVVLADCSGQASLLIDGKMTRRIGELSRYKRLLASMNVSVYSWGIGGMLLNWKDLPVGVNAARLLPCPECPEVASEALAQLVGMINEIQAPAIQAAFNELIHTAGPGLLHARASWNDHHNFAGGLLVHTVEVIESAHRESQYVFPGDPTRRDLIGLIALAHDIAKSELHCPGSSNAYSRGLGHKLASVSMVEPALRQLGDAEPSLGLLAGQMLDWLCKPKAGRLIRQCPEAELVQRADELSAMNAMTHPRPLSYREIEVMA